MCFRGHRRLGGTQVARKNKKGSGCSTNTNFQKPKFTCQPYAASVSISKPDKLSLLIKTEKQAQRMGSIPLGSLKACHKSQDYMILNCMLHTWTIELLPLVAVAIILRAVKVQPVVPETGQFQASMIGRDRSAVSCSASAFVA